MQPIDALSATFRRQTLAEKIAANTAALRKAHKAPEQREVLAELERVTHAAARRLVTSTTTDNEARQLAKRRADAMAEAIDGINAPSTTGQLLQWLNGQLVELQARPFEFAGDVPQGEQLRGFFARAKCPIWWRRALRRAIVRQRETEAGQAGEVCATRRQPYVTHDTAKRHAQRGADSAAMMEATHLENEAGELFTLAELASKSTGNKAIRRGELMTRIKGCERLAVVCQVKGSFLTLTLPSRFHAVHRKSGQRNERHTNETPRDGQDWLCKAWARARAKLQRLKLQCFGFRVAEPHHDGTPHWHALLWAPAGQLQAVVRVIREAWLRDEGDEPGAAEYRVKDKDLEAGGALAYIAKYISKNIDDAGAVGAEGHTDNDHANFSDAVKKPEQEDLFGGTAQRVAAWASAWSIRQFQAIGQPPVTVWRELRRVPADALAAGTFRIREAGQAVNRDGGRRADWAGYVLSQGGLFKGRRYLIRVATVDRLKVGRYETTERACPVGVVDTTGPGDWHLSNRKEWRPRSAWAEADRNHAGGIWAPKRAHPWTRVNNCTQATMINGRVMAKGEPLRTWLDEISGRGATPQRPNREDPTDHHPSHRP